MQFAHDEPWPKSCHCISLNSGGNSGVVMADIFLSYSSKHRDLTSVLAQELEAEGLSVCWDTTSSELALPLPTGENSNGGLGEIMSDGDTPEPVGEP